MLPAEAEAESGGPYINAHVPRPEVSPRALQRDVLRLSRQQAAHSGTERMSLPGVCRIQAEPHLPPWERGCTLMSPHLHVPPRNAAAEMMKVAVKTEGEKDVL